MKILFTLRNTLRLCVAGLLLGGLTNSLPAAPITGFDDISYWVGSGSNRSALVIQWNDGEQPSSVVWGYRWDDLAAPNVETLMFDLAGQISFVPAGVPPGTPPVVPPGADSRLSLAVDVFTWGNLISGISYDQNGLDSGEFSQTVRDQSGYGSGGESWTLYTLGTGSAWPTGSVLPSDFGISDTALVNNGWFGFSYTAAFAPPDYDPVAFTFDAPVSAVPEPSGIFLAATGVVLVFLRRRHATRI